MTFLLIPIFQIISLFIFFIAFYLIERNLFYNLLYLILSIFFLHKILKKNNLFLFISILLNLLFGYLFLFINCSDITFFINSFVDYTQTFLENNKNNIFYLHDDLSIFIYMSNLLEQQEDTIELLKISNNTKDNEILYLKVQLENLKNNPQNTFLVKTNTSIL